MIEIVLPFISNNINFYKKLKDLAKENYFFTEIKFSHLYGNLPWSYWHSNKNSNFNNKNIFLEKDLKEFNNCSNFPLILDIANINLSEQDLKDKKMNMILRELNNGANKISCSDLNIMNLLKKEYPYYDYIFSENAGLIFPFTNEIIDIMVEQNEISYIILDKKLTDENFNFSSVKNKTKIYIKIGNSCKENCQFYKECLKKENDLQYSFSENSKLENCIYTNSLYHNVTIKEEIEHYKKM